MTEVTKAFCYYQQFILQLLSVATLGLYTYCKSSHYHLGIIRITTFLKEWDGWLLEAAVFDNSWKTSK